MTDVKIWRVYNNGEIKNETHVLQPHFTDGQRYAGFDGSVDAWSTHNKTWRYGCAQIKQEGDARPEVIYNGYLSSERLEEIINLGLR